MSEEPAAFHVQDKIVLWNSCTHLLKCGIRFQDNDSLHGDNHQNLKSRICNVGICGKEIIVTAHIHNWRTTPCQLYATAYAALTF